LLAKSLCPQSPLLLTQLPGVAPTVLRLLDLPPTICFISSALLVMGMVQNILKAISRIAAMEPKDIQEPAPLYFTHFFVLLYALSSVLNRRDDDFKSRYEPSQTIALDNSASAHSSSFGKSQNFIPWETKNRGFFWNKYEIILVVSSLIIALMYTGIADISDQGKTYYYLISIINIMILSLSFMGPYTLFAALTTASTLIIPFQFLFLSLKEVLVSKDPFGSADIIVDFVQIFLVFPFLCLGEMSLVLSMFKYHLFNM
jgi:hypothetical protein